MSNDSDLRTADEAISKKDIALLLMKFIRGVVNDKANRTPAEVAVLPELIKTLLERF